MSETLKPDVQFQEQDITSTPEQAADATTNEFIEHDCIEEETPQVQTEADFPKKENENSKPSNRQEIIAQLKEIAESEDVLNCRNEIESLKILFYRMRTAEIEEGQKSIAEEGGNEAIFIPQDELEEPFKEVMNVIKPNAVLGSQRKRRR